jgi:hypothetical protein
MSVTSDEIIAVLKELRTLAVIDELETAVKRLDVLSDRCGVEVNLCKKISTELLRRQLEYPFGGRWPDSL